MFLQLIKLKKIFIIFTKLTKFIKILDILEFNSIKEKVVFDDIWFVSSKKSFYKENVLPNFPHIDKIRKFKIMIYLNF